MDRHFSRVLEFVLWVKFLSNIESVSEFLEVVAQSQMPKTLTHSSKFWWSRSLVVPWVCLGSLLGSFSAAKAHFRSNDAHFADTFMFNTHSNIILLSKRVNLCLKLFKIMLAFDKIEYTNHFLTILSTKSANFTSFMSLICILLIFKYFSKWVRTSLFFSKSFYPSSSSSGLMYFSKVYYIWSYFLNSMFSSPTKNLSFSFISLPLKILLNLSPIIEPI